MQTKLKIQDAGHLLGKLRQFCSLSKAEGTAEIIHKHFADQRMTSVSPVVVFVWFRETAFKLIDLLSQPRQQPIPSLSKHTSSDGTTVDSLIDLSSDDCDLDFGVALDSDDESSAKSQTALTCVSLTGDIIQQSVRLHC